MGLGFDEVVGPDVVAALRSQSDTGAVVTVMAAGLRVYVPIFDGSW